jgi:hypothetical protein
VALEAAFYAGNALSTTMPGGPVLSATFVYRQQRLWGASPVVASWQLVMSGALQVVGLALLGLGGAFLLGAKNNPFSLLFSLGGFIALLLLAQAVATRPELIDGIGVRVLSWINSARQAGAHRAAEVARDADAARVGAAEPTRARGGVQLVAVQLIADVACLAFAACAAGGSPSLASLTVAYAAARAVGSIPVDARWAARRRGGAGAGPGVQRDDAARRDLGDADLPAGQLDLHLRDRLGGVLLHVPHGVPARPRRRRRRTHRRRPRGLDNRRAPDNPAETALQGPLPPDPAPDDEDGR